MKMTVTESTKGNLGLLVGKFIVYKDGKKDSDLVKESLHSAHLWVQLPRLPLSFRMNLLWKKFLNLSRKPTKLMLILKFSPKPFLHEYVWK